MTAMFYAWMLTIAPSMTLNPNTSDPTAGKQWIVVTALVVSAVLIIVFVAMSSSKKKKKNGKDKRK